MGGCGFVCVRACARTCACVPARVCVCGFVRMRVGLWVFVWVYDFELVLLSLPILHTGM